MLDEGVQAAMRYLGFDYRTVCYVERDSYAAASLVAKMEGKALDQALIWDDLKTFPGRAFRGRIHSIAAGFPCQDLSLAGQREGLDGKRSGLFFTILDIADDCEAQYLFLENVAGITSATASVVYEAEELDERAAARVVGHLADRGWDAEWLHILAADVGASHRRERWFCFAWRKLDNATGARRNGKGRRPAADQQSGQCVSGEGCQNLADSGNTIWRRELQPRESTEHWRRGPSESGGALADTERSRSQERGCESGNVGPELATLERNRARVHGGGNEFFAPGPADPRWPGILAEFPELAPAIEPGVCRLVNGLSYRLDEYRADRLRCGGNGVVALQAAAGFIALIRRARQ